MVAFIIVLVDTRLDDNGPGATLNAKRFTLARFGEVLLTGKPICIALHSTL